MKFDPEKHHRRSIRLKEYDYSQPGAYYVTICTWQREYLFGDIVNEEMQLNPYGQIVWLHWQNLPKHHRHLQLDSFVVMPNHLHGIIMLTDETGEKRHPLSEIIRGFKTFSSRRINQMRRLRGVSVWQRDYYDRILRCEESLPNIRQYIDNNPRQWVEDEENQQNYLSHRTPDNKCNP